MDDSTVCERDIEKHLVAVVKEMGGMVRKLKWIGRRAAPDRLVMLPTKTVRGHVTHPAVQLFVELKRPGEGPTKAQAAEHREMREMGCHVLVINSFDGVDELREW